jgi:hypothetical protein
MAMVEGGWDVICGHYGCFVANLLMVGRTGGTGSYAVDTVRGYVSSTFYKSHVIKIDISESCHFIQD